MNILLDPNVAYLTIVAGFLITVFAVVTPGTGLFELGALFALTLAGWQVYQLPVNVWALVIVLLSAVPFVFAFKPKYQKRALALTGITFVIGSAFLFRSEVWWRPAVNPILAIVASIFGGGFFWLMTTKVLEARAKLPAHNLVTLVGAIGETRTEVHLEGSVYVGGEMWTARSEEVIPAGTRVRVLERDGFALWVEVLEEDNKE